MPETLTNPILNRPYDPPTRHFVLGPKGPTGEIRDGRRPSESFLPIPQSRKRGASTAAPATSVELDFDFTHERREKNSLINDLRREVELWRVRGYQRVTPTTRKLLEHWADEGRENRILFGQREAAETAIFLAEAAGRDGFTDWRRPLAEANADHNAGLPRIALKMATGSGKTVVMAMLIAWQTLNKVASPRDARFVNRFLIVTPGITIRDRLRVLQPDDDENYYDQRELVPADLRAQLGRAQVIVTNYHAFLPRDAKEIKGVNAFTRAILTDGKPDPFRETTDAVATRVLRGFGTGTKLGEIVVFNDEAHHCYQDKPQRIAGLKLTKEQQEANTDARVWFRGLQWIAKHSGIKQIYDLSATPFYLGGSGYNEGHIFPWVVSDYSLMDSIEAGIVKVPRIPVDDDANADDVTYLRLWDHIGMKLPKRAGTTVTDVVGWVPPVELEGALFSLYRSYEKQFAAWKNELESLGEPPPVMIVVCPNTIVSKLVAEWIAGGEVENGDAVVHRTGALPLLGNVVDGKPLPRPRTILVDSKQLESGDAFKADFKTAAAEEIAAFKEQYRRANPGADAEQLTDEDLLREVLNTVGKKGKLGEQVRCVVSVAMLTEGWDANTVTHILGVRAFSSQLLCEQVVGRGLRRRSYALNEEGFFEPEYSNIYGIPFAFIPSDDIYAEPKDKLPAIEVGAVEGREHYRITFPRLDGYRLEIPDRPLEFDPADAARLAITPDTVPNTVEVAGIVGESDVDVHAVADAREQRAAYRIADLLLRAHFSDGGTNPRPWLFPQLREITTQWLRQNVDYAPGYGIEHLLSSTERQHDAAAHISNAVTRFSNDEEGRAGHIRPILRRFDPVGSTEDVRFVTRKHVVETKKSEVSHVTLDGKDGNTWEQILALELEAHGDVAAYVKNDHLGFTIPYIHKGRSHAYVPDFLVRLQRRDGDIERTLIIEVSGGQKSKHSPGSVEEKARTARDSWCTAVNNHRGFGRWGYAEFTSAFDMKEALAEAIANLYADAAITGDPDLRDDTLFDLSREA